MEKLIGNQTSLGSMPLTGWDDENALLVFSRKIQPVRQIQGQHARTERQFHYRLSKPYKEFKFYHYNDPRAYIIQYRRDCSSLSTQSGTNGPLEMFMQREKKEERKMDESVEEKERLKTRSQNLDSNCLATKLVAGSSLKPVDTVALGFEVETDTVKAQHSNRLAPICDNRSSSNAYPTSVSTTGLGRDRELPESGKLVSASTLTQTTRRLATAPFSAVERTYQRSQLIAGSGHARRDLLSKASKTGTLQVPSENKQTGATLSVNAQNSGITCNQFWNPATSIRTPGITNKLKTPKTEKLMGSKKKIHPSIGVRTTYPSWVCQTQSQLPNHQRTSATANSGSLLHEMGLREADLTGPDQNLCTSKSTRIRDGSDPAFGRTLYERLLKLEYEQNKLESLRDSSGTNEDPSSPILEPGDQTPITSNNAQQIQQPSDLISVKNDTNT